MSDSISTGVMSGIGSFRPKVGRPSSDACTCCDDDRLTYRGRWSDISGDPNLSSGRAAGHDEDYEGCAK